MDEQRTQGGVVIDPAAEPTGPDAATPTPTPPGDETHAPTVGTASTPPAPARDDHLRDTPRQPRIIALMNQKGGVGKTTTTANLGAALARRKQRVLLVDLDPQAHLSLCFGLDPDGLDLTVYELLTDDAVSAAEIVHQIDRQLAVMPAHVNLAGVEAELQDRIVTGAAQTALRSACEQVTRLFDYVLIDCPPSLGLLTINALAMAREVIVPMQAHFLALQGLSKLFETVTMVRRAINPSLRVSGIVLCMHEGQTILANEVLNDLNGFLEGAREQDVPWRDAVVYQPPIRRNIKLAESPSFGKSIFDYAPDCHGAQDYAKLAESVAKQAVPV